MKTLKIVLAVAVGLAGFSGFSFSTYEEALAAGKDATAKKDFKTAIAAFGEAAEKADNQDKRGTATLSLADAYLSVGEKEKAKAEWVKISADEKLNAYCRGWALIKLGDSSRADKLFPEALAKYDEALKIAGLPDWMKLEVFNRKIPAAVALGKYDEAEAVRKQAVVLPCLNEAQKADLMLREPDLLIQRRKYAEATSLLEKMLQEAGFVQKGKAYLLLAKAYKGGGNPGKAAEACKKGLETGDGLKAEFEYLLKGLEASGK